MFPSLSKQTIEKTNTTRDTFNPQIKACINYEPRDIQGGAEYFCFLTIYLEMCTVDFEMAASQGKEGSLF